VEYGPTHDVFENPVDARTAEYVARA